MTGTDTPLRVPTQTRAHRTRAALVAAAATEFAEKGYARATAKSIATRAGVAVGSFYQYFPNKDAVLHELASIRTREASDDTLRRIQAPAEALPTDPEELAQMVRGAMFEIVDEVIAYHRANRDLHAVLTERRHADARLDRITTRAEHALVRAIAEMIRRWGRVHDPEAAAFVAFGCVEGAVHAHVLGEPMVEDERFCIALVDGLMAIALPGGPRADA
ncbi:MAG: TetR/AcrR family transcriptional regulator [Myxococcota bacterium]